MSVVYTNFGGQIVHENRGGTETFFTSDPLGSIIEGRNSSGTQTFSFTYWPYGEIRTSSGTNPSQFDFVGSLGYYRENSARTYVRARFLRKELGRWLNVDPLWPNGRAYEYVGALPNQVRDATGLWWANFEGCTASDTKLIVDAFNKILYGAIDRFAECVQESGCPPITAPQCLLDHRNAMPPTKPTFNVKCDYNCNKSLCGKGRKGPPPTITICMPQPSTCGPLACVIAHELLHMCGILGTGNTAAAFLCVASQIPGCTGFRGGHGLDIE